MRFLSPELSDERVNISVRDDKEFNIRMEVLSERYGIVVRKHTDPIDLLGRIVMSKRLIYLVSFVFVPLIGLSQHVQADLVAYWSLDESSGITAADMAGGDNNGTLYGEVEWRPYEGKFGGALFYSPDDTTARVEIPTM